MAKEKTKKAGFKDFPRVYWVAILFEFFERGSYYGMMSILSVYLTEQLGFSKPGVGVIKGTIQPLLYFLPIITGAIADRLGYRKMLMVAFSLLGLGYFLTSQARDYWAVYCSLVLMALGAGAFKPSIAGTIARVTDARTSTLGFGIFYWSINLGAFVFPMFLVPYLKSLKWSYVLIASAICTASMLIPTLFLYKEPVPEEVNKGETLCAALKKIIGKIWTVFLDWRFILFIFIYSWFWILYFQMFDSVLWYVKAFVDAEPLNAFVRDTFSLTWRFDIEHVTVINALTIIVLQLFISALVKNTKALPTMVAGVTIATLGMIVLAISSHIWVFLLGIFLFSIGEMTAHPKFLSYLGLIAPSDKKATYTGFGFLYGVFGSFIGGIIGAILYVRFIDKPMILYVQQKLAATGSATLLADTVKIEEALKVAAQIGLTQAEVSRQAMPAQLWLVFSGIGLLCIIGLLLYQKFIGTREAADKLG